MTTTVHLAEGAASVTAPGLQVGPDRGPRAPAERVTLSDEARLASKALPQAPTSQVRWYRAARGARPAAAVVPPAPRRPVHPAVAAYLRQLPAPGAAEGPATAQALAA